MERKYDIYSEMNLRGHSKKKTVDTNADYSGGHIGDLIDGTDNQDDFLLKLAKTERILTSDVSSSSGSDDEDEGDDDYSPEDDFVVIHDDDSDSGDESGESTEVSDSVGDIGDGTDRDSDSHTDSDIDDTTDESDSDSDYVDINFNPDDPDLSLNVDLRNKSPGSTKNPRKNRRTAFERYFQRNISVVCRRCKQIGHVRSKCFNDPHVSPCYVCGSTSHLSHKCTQLLCQKCGEQGHDRYNCQKDKFCCFLCNAPGHYKSDCPLFSPYQTNMMRCPKCLELNCNCRSNLSLNIRQTCPICGDNHLVEDHYSRNIHKNKNSRKVSGKSSNVENKNNNKKTKYGKNGALDLDQFYITPKQYSQNQRENAYKSKRSDHGYQFDPYHNPRDHYVDGNKQYGRFKSNSRNEYPPGNRNRYQDDNIPNPPENSRRSKKDKINHSKFQYYDDDSFQYKPYMSPSGKKKNSKRR